MKISILTTAAVLLFAGGSFAQDDAMRQERMERKTEKKEQIEAQRVAFITNELKLESADSKAFWAVVNEFDAKKKAKAEEMKKREGGAKSKNIEELTDEQLAMNMQNRMEMKKAMLTLEQEYNEKYISTIGVRKTAEYYRAEEKFKRELLKNMRDRKGGAGAASRPAPGR